jgi:hypothetical protein
MSLFKGRLILSCVLGIVTLAGVQHQAIATGPAFLVSVSNNIPRVAEMVKVTILPFGTNVIATTNSGAVYVNAAPWSAMAFGQGGTLYGIELNGGLGIIDPATAAYTVFTNLHFTSSVPGAESLLEGTGMAISTNGTAYVTVGGDLYTADFASGLCSYVGSFFGVGLPDVLALAEAPDGNMFGLTLGLCSVNLTNAELTQIGYELSFGGGEYPIAASGAAFGSDGNLYMVGWDNTRTNSPKLYQVNTNDGSAIAFGDLPFGAYGLLALSSTNSGAPTIVTPPTSQSARAGETMIFSVTGIGTPAPSLQWFFDGSEILGATNPVLSIANVSPTNAGTYFVVLSNSIGTATSQLATLSVTPAILASSGSIGDFTNSILGLTTNPPTETLLSSNMFFPCLSFDPEGKLFAIGENFTRSSSNQIIGSRDGLYSIDTQTWATNFIGDFQTNMSALPAPIGMAFSPSGILYSASGGSLYTLNISTAQRTKVGAFTNGVAIGGIAFAPNGRLYGGETNLYLINPTNATVTNIGALNGVSASILADMKYGSDGFLYFCNGSDSNLYRLNTSNAQVSLVANYTSALSGLAFVPIPTVITAEPTNDIVMSGSTANFSVAASGTAPFVYQWYFDNVAIKGGTNSSLTISNALARNNGTYYVVVSNSLGSVISSVSTLTTYIPPTITRLPKSEVINAGETISLSVAATGSSLQYQWQLNGTNLPGKNSASLIIGNAQPNDAGTYTVVVSVPSFATPATASTTVAVLPLKPSISSPANNAMIGTTNATITGREPANGGAAAIMYQVNGGAAQAAEVSSNGLTWTAPVTLSVSPNTFLVWATNSSGASAAVKASYILNPFIPVAGAYCGLFSDSSAPAFSNSGYFQLTAQSDRAFSGNLLLDGARTTFTGQFDTNGLAAVTVGPASHIKYDLALQLDLSGVNPLMGSVSNIAQGWMASLSAVHAGFGGTSPATNYEGTYLLTINGATNAELAPAGYSYAVATINSSGGVSLSGAMADGAVFSDAGAAISQSGAWPLYVSLHSGKASALAWINFPMHSAPSQTTTNQAMWFETPGANGHFYTNGFNLLTNELSLIVERHLSPARGIAVLPSTNYTAQIFGGNLAATLDENIIISANNAVVPAAPNTSKLSITINASQGTFSGSFASPIHTGTTILKGVLLPDSNMGFGYFLGTNQAGGIIIQP